MEAREFFPNGPMHEITVSGTPEEWKGVLLQLNVSEGYWTDSAIELEVLLNAIGVNVD